MTEKIFWRPVLRRRGCYINFFQIKFNENCIIAVFQADALRFFKAVSSEIWETRFLLSCLPIIRSGIKLIKKVLNFNSSIYNPQV